jgi:hypothetical protein
MKLQTFTMLCVLGIALSVSYESLNAQVRVNDNLGNHTATKDLDMNQHSVNNIGLLNYYLSTDIGDVTTDTNIGAANVTVDKYTIFQVNQTTANRTLSLLSPTNNTLGRKAYVKNTGTAPFLLYGVAVPANRIVELFYNGSAWSVVNTDADAFSLRINKLIAATDINSIDNANYGQTWNWNTLAGGKGLSLEAVTSAATNNTQTLLNLSLSGANGAAGQTTYGAQISNAHTGAGTNVGLSVSANSGTTNTGLNVAVAGGTTNYAALFSGGNVGIGTATPGATLDVNGTVNITGTASASTVTGTTGIVAGKSDGTQKGSLMFYDKTAIAAKTITLGLPDGLANSYSLTLPGDKGTTGQVLTSSDGTGALSWVTPIAYTAGTGLTLTGSSFGVNGSQNITTLSNLTTLGIVHSTAIGGLSSSLIVNADVKSDAAIDGTKISPNFGTQNIVTTGTASASTVTGTTGIVAGKSDGTQKGSLMFYDKTATAAKAITLGLPDALTNSYSLTLPAATPTTDGLVLASTTDGVLSWKAASVSPIEILPTNNLVSTGTGAVLGTTAPNTSQNSIVFGSNTLGIDTTYPSTPDTNQPTHTASEAIIMGTYAGGAAGTINGSIVLGNHAAYYNTGAHDGVIIGAYAGSYGRYAFDKAVLIGWNAGRGPSGASSSSLNSVMIGPNVGRGTNTQYSDLKQGNIIIGNDITLPDGSGQSMNLGGVLFGTGLHYTDFTGKTDNDVVLPSATPETNGKIGIGTNQPGHTLDVVGDVSAKRYLTTMPAAAIEAAAATTVDLSAGNVFTLNVAANIDALTLNNAPTQSATFVFKLSYSSSNAYTITWPAEFLWSGGTPPVLTCVSGKTDILSIIFDGTKYYCSYALNF